VPLYEYECAKDGRFELIRKFSDPPVSVCPTCGRPVEKLLSSPAIQFKGTGWYVTDYAKKDGGSSASKEAKEAKESSKDTAASKDSAPKESSSSAAAPSESSPKTTPSPKDAASSSSSTK
jgi:putative FmdB family regulatory protein